MIEKTDEQHKDVQRVRTAYILYYAASQAAFDRGIFILFLLAQGFTGQQVGILQFALFAASFLSEVPMGILGDKFGRKRAVLTGLLVFIGYCFGVISCSGFIAFLLLYCFYGVAMSLISGSDKALLYDELVRNKSEKQYIKIESRAQMAGSIVLGGAILAGGYLQAISWDAVYIAYAAALILSFVAFLFIPEAVAAGTGASEPASGEGVVTDQNAELGGEALSGSADTESEGGTTREAIDFFMVGNGRSLLPLFMFFGIVNFVFAPYYIFSQALFQEQGLSAASVAGIFAVAQIANAVGFGLSASIQKRLSEKAIFTLFPLGFSILLFGNSIGSVEMSLLVFLGSCIVISSMEPIYSNYINVHFYGRIRATANSFDALVQSVFTSAGFLFFGYLMEQYSLADVMTLSAVVPLAAAYVAWRCFANRLTVAEG